jgi:hypothetical protein
VVEVRPGTSSGRPSPEREIDPPPVKPPEAVDGASPTGKS